MCVSESIFCHMTLQIANKGNRVSGMDIGFVPRRKNEELRLSGSVIPDEIPNNLTQSEKAPILLRDWI